MAGLGLLLLIVGLVLWLLVSGPIGWILMVVGAVLLLIGVLVGGVGFGSRGYW